MGEGGGWRNDGVLPLVVGATDFMNLGMGAGIGMCVDRNSTLWEGDIRRSGCQNRRSRGF